MIQAGLETGANERAWLLNVHVGQADDGIKMKVVDRFVCEKSDAGGARCWPPQNPQHTAALMHHPSY